MQNVISADLVELGNIFERDLVGISQKEADKFHVLTGCRTLEEYLVRVALNQTGFKDLTFQVFGKTERITKLLSDLENLVRDVSFLHRVSFILRQRFTDKICRATLTDPQNVYSTFARQLL